MWLLEYLREFWVLKWELGWALELRVDLCATTVFSVRYCEYDASCRDANWRKPWHSCSHTKTNHLNALCFQISKSKSSQSKTWWSEWPVLFLSCTAVAAWQMFERLRTGSYSVSNQALIIAPTFRGRKIYEPPRYMSVAQAASQLLEIVERKRQEAKTPLGMCGRAI